MDVLCFEQPLYNENRGETKNMIQIDSALLKQLPQLCLGIIAYRNCAISRSPQMFRGRFNLFQEQVRLQYEGKEIAEIPPIASWRQAFRQLGVSPSRYRPSAEALLRRVIKGQGISEINSGVDVNNLFSLQHLLPIGIYDQNFIDGSITCGIGDENEAFEALNGRQVSMTGKLLLRDTQGPFGSPYVDSQRTAVTENTTNCLQVLFIIQDEHSPDIMPLLQEIGSLFTHINGGETVEMKIIT